MKPSPLHWLTCLPDHFAAAAASGTCFSNRKEALLIDDFAAAVTDGASDQSAIRLGAAPLAFGTRLEFGDLDIGRQSAHGVFETDLKS